MKRSDLVGILAAVHLECMRNQCHKCVFHIGGDTLDTADCMLAYEEDGVTKYPTAWTDRYCLNILKEGLSE